MGDGTFLRVSAQLLGPGKPPIGEDKDGAALGQPPKLAVDGGTPHPQPPRSQAREETSMKIGRTEKSLGFFQNFK